MLLLSRKDNEKVTKIRTKDIQLSNNLARITVTYEIRMAIIVNPLLSTVIPTLLTEREKTTKFQDVESARSEQEYLDLAKRSGLQVNKKYTKESVTIADEVAKFGSSIKGTNIAAIARNAIELEPTNDRLTQHRKKAIVTIE